MVLVHVRFTGERSEDVPHKFIISDRATWTAGKAAMCKAAGRDSIADIKFLLPDEFFGEDAVLKVVPL